MCTASLLRRHRSRPRPTHHPGRDRRGRGRFRVRGRAAGERRRVGPGRGGRAGRLRGRLPRGGAGRRTAARRDGREVRGAYRTGFDLDPARPSDAEVTGSARHWRVRGGRPDDPALVRHLLWIAVDLGLPLQLHTGFGDNDIRLHRADPARLTDRLRLTAGTIPVLLLHCWPSQRQAAYLAAVFERVHLDVGPTLHHVGPARAGAVLADALEVTPFRKLLYSSDAYGVPEFFHLGALAFRQGLAEPLQERVDTDETSLPDALRIARWAGRDNARRVHRFPDDSPGDG